MNVASVNSTTKANNLRNYYNYSKVAGYGALGAGAFCLIQGVRHKKSHKALGFIALILALAHVGLIEYVHFNSLKLDYTA